MRACVWLAAALLALAAARRPDQDFEFDEAPEAATARPRRPRRYVFDPQNPLCQALVCKKREVCLLKDAFTALCATKKDVLRRGDMIVAASAAGVAGGAEGDDEDVFYEARPDERAPPAPATRPRADRCVGCGGAARAQFLCGSDNRTYSSLCRLDLHNCVRRTSPPVRLACRGFCPCASPTPPRRDERRRRRLESTHNEVLPERSYRRNSQGRQRVQEREREREQEPEGERSGCQLGRMADRLLDWFSVLMADARAAPPPAAGQRSLTAAWFPRDCKPEVRWMFAHLDAGADGVLSTDDLYALRHDERERCLRPFLAWCARRGGGGGGGGGGGVPRAGGISRAAWCACLGRAARPCAALARAHPAREGAYVPACDARGWYRPRQCHAALAVCWCVDAHGVELPGSRTKGAPACPGENETESAMNETELAQVESNDVSQEAEGGEGGEAEGEGQGAGAGEREGEGERGGERDGAPDDDEDGGASGDRELRF